MKISSNRLEKFDYHLKRLLGNTGAHIREIRNNGELIALGDNQALRSIRSIRYERNPDIIRYDPEALNLLYEQKKELKKLPFTDSVKKQISIINTTIDKMLFIPEYISVVIDDVAHYKKIIKNGLYINNKKYVRLMCSAGQARVNTVILVREDYEEELKKRLRCGAKSVKITKNKYNAYFALSSSSTYLIPKPNVLLINDCEIEMEKRVDWISKIPPTEKHKLSNNERVDERTISLMFNLFDGCGAVSVEFAKRVADALELDYIPSAFCIRCAYVKGMVFVVDFKQYARELGIIFQKDLYGVEQKVEDMDMILTKSQFKLYNAYDSIEDYHRLCEENGILWGVTKVTPKKDDTYFRSNYQFCQAIDLRKDSDVAELCQPTIDWLSGICGGDVNHTLLFLLGRMLENPDIDYNDILNLTSDNVAKALILNPNMINEEYIKNTIIMSVNKKIRESYLGKLILDGNFSVMIPDMYAFMQHAFGQEVTGALKEFEHYSNFWNQRGKTEVVAMRSPLTWRSEVNKLNLKNNELTEKWFKYLTSGIVYNVWGCDCIIHADSDFDGDIVATTDNPVFLRCRYDNLPITYTKSTVDKEYIKEEELYLADIQSFNSEIGSITNISTAFYELLSLYEDNPEKMMEVSEILERLKLIRKCQGDSIDKAKGIKIEPMPKHWTKKVKASQDNLDIIEFINSIVADRKPYFFRYLYPKENAKYINYRKKKNDYCEMKFFRSLDELLELSDSDLSCAEKDFKYNNYLKYIPLIDYNGRMNKICHHMEKNLSEITSRCRRTHDTALEIMKSGKNPNFCESDIELMNEFYLEYKNAKKAFQLKRNNGFEGSSSAVNLLNDTIKEIRLGISDKISASLEYQCDLAIYVCYEMHPSRTKDFCWEIFGNQIIKNIEANSTTPALLPVPSDDGDIYYLGKTYKVMEVNV